MRALVRATGVRVRASSLPVRHFISANPSAVYAVRIPARLRSICQNSFSVQRKVAVGDLEKDEYQMEALAKLDTLFYKVSDDTPPAIQVPV